MKTKKTIYVPVKRTGMCDPMDEKTLMITVNKKDRILTESQYKELMEKEKERLTKQIKTMIDGFNDILQAIFNKEYMFVMDGEKNKAYVYYPFNVVTNLNYFIVGMDNEYDLAAGEEYAVEYFTQWLLDEIQERCDMIEHIEDYLPPYVPFELEIEEEESVDVTSELDTQEETEEI